MLIISSFALISAVSSALTPSPIPGSTFPKYPTVVQPKSYELDNDNVTEDYNKVRGNISGLYRAFRNDLYVFPLQHFIAAETGSTDKCSIGSQTGEQRTFYTHDSTLVGSYPAKITAGTSSTYASGGVWVACTDISDALKCNGGAGYNNLAITKSHNVKNRLVMKASATGAI
jgi:hypothetical protein